MLIRENKGIHADAQGRLYTAEKDPIQQVLWA
jgi:hypothetical protein